MDTYIPHSHRMIVLEWNAFMRGFIIPKYEHDQIVVLTSFIPFLPIGIVTPGLPAHGNTSSIPVTKLTPAEAVNKAAAPIEDMVIAIAKPITIISSTWGCIECASGHPANGIQRIKFALLGYVSIRWLRIIIDAIGPY